MWQHRVPIGQAARRPERTAQVRIGVMPVQRLQAGDRDAQHVPAEILSCQSRRRHAAKQHRALGAEASDHRFDRFIRRRFAALTRGLGAVQYGGAQLFGMQTVIQRMLGKARRPRAHLELPGNDLGFQEADVVAAVNRLQQRFHPTGRAGFAAGRTEAEAIAFAVVAFERDDRHMLAERAVYAKATIR